MYDELLEFKKFLENKIDNTYVGDSYQLALVTAYTVCLEKVKAILEKEESNNE